jgi:hypothetical protein
MPARDPALRRQNASIAALERWSREDPRANAERGQRGLVAKFEKEARAADPDASDAEIARRGQCAYRAHQIRNAKASAAARKARASGAA